MRQRWGQFFVSFYIFYIQGNFFTYISNYISWLLWARNENIQVEQTAPIMHWKNWWTLFYFWWTLKNTFTQPLCLLSSFNRVQLFGTPWTEARQAPLSMAFSRQEYWSGLPCPPPGALPHPGIKPGSPALQADSLPSEPPGKPLCLWGIISTCIVHRRNRKASKVKEFVEEHTAVISGVNENWGF